TFDLRPSIFDLRSSSFDLGPSGLGLPLSEDLRLEAPQHGAATPAVPQKPGLQACLLDKPFSGPLILGRDLRQQHPALAVVLDQQAVPSDDDFFVRAHALERAENRNFDVEPWHLSDGDRWKARIFRARQPRASGHRLDKRIILFEMTDASAQLACQVQA